MKHSVRHVYFAQREPGSLIKIGISWDPQYRARVLWSPDAGQRGCRLLASLPTSAWPLFSDESMLHERFASSCHVGEWFYPSADILDFIEEKVA